MESLHLSLEHTLGARLEALALLQQESFPGLPYSEEDAARQALARGLDVMLAEFLYARQAKPSSH